MYVVKRNGNKVPFDLEKISIAISGAFQDFNEEFDDLKLLDYIYETIEECYGTSGEIHIENIQDIVEDSLIKFGYIQEAKAYIRYRYKQYLLRKANTTDKSIKELLDGTSEFWNKENSNKNAKWVTTQRDYIAGITSKDIARRFIFPKDVVEAHDAGIIHIHDMDYAAQNTLHNCFSRDTSFVTIDGIKSFEDFEDGDEVQVLSLDGKYHRAIVHSYGKQELYSYDFSCGKKEHYHTIRATENHRWILKDGSETTELKIGDQLAKAPAVYQQELDWENLPYNAKLAWCKGFGIGDGTVEYHSNRTRIRLCGEKDRQYLNRFMINGCSIRNTIYPNSEDKEVVIYNYSKEIPEFQTLLELQCFLNGLYCADGNTARTKTGRINYRLQSSKKEVIDFIRQYADSCGLYITKERELTGEITNFGKRPYTIYFSFNPDFYFNYRVLDKRKTCKQEEVWCLEVEETHNFILQYGIPTGNCCLINLDDMLQNGTVVNGVTIDKPHRLSTAMTISTQIIAAVASSQYGGCTITLTHLAPFVRDSYNRYLEDAVNELSDLNYYDFVVDSNNEAAKMVAKRRTQKEISDAVQTLNYQLNSLTTTNGQSPFVSVMMYLGETEKYKDELAMLIEEVLKQRIKGMKNKIGVYVTPAFPKLLYVLEEDNIYPDSKYWYLTELAAKCTAKRMVPDYISEKIMKQLKLSKGETEGNGDCYPCIN